MSTVLLLAAQLAVILLVTRVCGWLARLCRQPQVLGEIAGGILLGPVALGRWFPGQESFLFAPGRLQGLELVSSAGLVLFLLLTGAELEIKATKSSIRSVCFITIGSVSIPFLAGLVVADPLAERFGVADATRTGFTMFTGVAMSITALPVLARILTDRQQGGRRVDAEIAARSLMAAALNDVIGWCALAAILALLHQGDAGAAVPRLVPLALFIVVMFVAVRPLLRRIALPEWPSAVVLVAMASVSAWVTNALGVHLFFGAFLAGVCSPRAWLTPRVEDRLKTVALWALPAFFAMTGLRMQPRLFDASGWSWLLVVVAVAVAGKVVGSVLGASAGGMSWAASLRVGVLLNTRGLVELIVLNAGYQEGILSGAVFTLFVGMAVITTAMTGPLLDAMEPRRL